MAELDVQPKSKTPWWIWLLILLVVLALIFFLRGCNKEDTAAVGNADSTANVQAVTVPDWDNVDFNAPNATLEEITDTSISVRGNESYTIYGLGENILFATGKSEIQAGAQKQLEQISASLNKRFNGASLAIYGNTDATGSASDNKELGEQRAEAVRLWLVNNAKVSEDKISIHSKGQSDPVATNETAKGRQMNRRVEIVAMAQ